MPWIRPKLNLMFGGLRGKNLNSDMECPWKADCPRYMREERIGPDLVRKVKRDFPLPSKMILVEQIQPHVRKYKCLYCNMSFFVDVDGRCLPEKESAPLKNPALIGGRKGVGIYH